MINQDEVKDEERREAHPTGVDHWMKRGTYIYIHIRKSKGYQISKRHSKNVEYIPEECRAHKEKVQNQCSIEHVR